MQSTLQKSLVSWKEKNGLSQTEQKSFFTNPFLWTGIGLTACGFLGWKFYTKSKQASEAKHIEQRKIKQKQLEEGYQAYLKVPAIENDKARVFRAHFIEALLDERSLDRAQYDLDKITDAYFADDRHEISPKDAINEPCRDGLTPLMKAVSAGNLKLVDWLLVKGANPHFKTKGDGFKTAIDLADFLQKNNKTNNEYAKIHSLLDAACQKTTPSAPQREEKFYEEAFEEFVKVVFADGSPLPQPKKNTSIEF
jgi:hypothetical protein